MATTDPRIRDAVNRALARGRADAEPDDQEAARRYATCRRTQTRWRNDGPPAARAFVDYLHRSADPIREAEVARVAAKLRKVVALSTPDAITRYRELLAWECEVEAEDRRTDVARGITWQDRAASSARDAAVDSEKAALELLFDARGVSEAEVLGGWA